MIRAFVIRKPEDTMLDLLFVIYEFSMQHSKTCPSSGILQYAPLMLVICNGFIATDLCLDEYGLMANAH
jgi:hypothetical protein